MAEDTVRVQYEVEAWIAPGRAASVQESIELALDADPYVEDAGVDEVRT